MSSSEEPSPGTPGDAAAPASAGNRAWDDPVRTDPFPDTLIERWPGPTPEPAEFATPAPADPSAAPGSGAGTWSAPPSYPPSGEATWAVPPFSSQPPSPGSRTDGYGPLTPGPGPRRRGHGGWMMAAAAVLAAGAMTGMLATPIGTLPSLTGPASSRPSTSAPATPAATPAEILKKNPIYSLKVTGTCPSQRIPASWKAFQTQVRALVDCENKAWSTALAKTSIPFSKPKISFYTKTTDSPCGHLDSNFPASYCSGDHTLYFSRASYQQGRYYRLSVSEFVFHEYAHHVQSLTGIFDASVTLTEDEDVTERRIELQAHCIAHYRLTHAGLKFSSADRADVEYQLGFSADAEGHGSAKAGRRWGEAGLNGKNIGACNTWTAKASAVK